jgi:hypothetical protein
MVGTALGLGSAAGFALDSDALGGGAGIAALSTLLGPKALSLFDNIARDARVVGSELTLARTGDHTPFFRRLSMLPTPDQGLAGATMDKFNILMKPGPEGLVSRVGDAIAQGGKASAKEVNPSAQPFRVGPGGEKIGQAPTISGATQKVANFLDKAGPLGRIGSPVESMGRFATGMAVGAAIPSSIGFVASGGQASGAVAGAVMSAPFTALGTGAGMYQNYKTKGDLYAKQIGDIQYYREHLTKNERAEFDALPANIRANVAGYSLSHPDVVFKQTSEGEGGFNPVTMEVSYNPNGTGFLKGTMAHEITHFMEVHGLTPMVNRILFGDQTTKTPGEFASYDKDGNIVYTDEFMQLRDIYMDRLRKDTSLDPDAVAEYEANPQKIGREIFADQGADFLLTGKREKALNQGPVGKLMQETLKGITGVSFLRDFLLKMNLPLNADGKFITSTDLFKGKLRKIPELQNVIEKYYKDVRGLKKAQIEGSEYTDPFTGKTRKEEGKKPIDDEFETLYSVEDQKNPNVVDKLNTGGIFKSNPQTGEIEKDALGNPIRMTKGEADKVSQAAGDHAADVLKRNGVEVETNDKGRPFVKDLPALSEAVIDQLAKGPIHPRQLAALREISRALRAGDGERAGMLIGYYASTQGRKAKAVPFAIRTTMPYGFELTSQGNIMVRLHDVDQIQKNLKFLKGEKQPKKLPNELVGMYDELFGNDNAVWDAFALYRQNTANGIDGRTGLDADPVIANKKLNFLNALHGGITKSQVAMNPVLNAIGYQMAGINKKNTPFGPATKTFRLDRVFNAERSGRASPVNEQRVINLMSPQGQKLYTPKPEADVQITDKLFMPASEAGAGKGKVAEAADLDFKISTRNPTAKNATENPITEDLIINTASIADDATMLESHALALQEYPGIKKNSKVPKRIIDRFVDHVVDNLLYLHDQVRPEVRNRSKLWYDGARNITEKWNQQYGNDKQSIAAGLASLSPQKDWFMNVDLARRMLDIYKDQSGFAFDKAMAKKYIQLFEKGIGKKKATEIAEAMVGKTLNELQSDFEQAAFIRSYDEVYNPREYQVVSPEGDFIGLAKSLDGVNKKVAWGSMTEISKAVKVLRNPSKESISTALGNAHKIRNFYNNILLPNADEFSVTIDTHAIAAALLRPLAGADLEVANNFGSKPKGAKRSIKNSSVKGISGTYGIYADAYRKAAEARGILPREMQSITWEAVRGLYEAKWKTKSNKAKIDNLWKKYENGELTLNETREQILESAGGITEPEWVTERSNSGADGTNESANKSQELYRPELGGSELRANPRRGRTNSRGSQEVNFLPAGNFSRQPANRIQQQAPAMPGNRFMLPAASAEAKSAERFR